MEGKGKFNELRFQRCERGFILTENEGTGLPWKVWAFDTINGVADWLVREYGDEEFAFARMMSGPDAGSE